MKVYSPSTSEELYYILSYHQPGLNLLTRDIFSRSPYDLLIRLAIKVSCQDMEIMAPHTYYGVEHRGVKKIEYAKLENRGDNVLTYTQNFLPLKPGVIFTAGMFRGMGRETAHTIAYLDMGEYLKNILIVDIDNN